MAKGLIHIYCGDGKGKTTAATGLAVRAAGTGRNVLIARFLKNEHSGELNALRKIGGIRILPIEKEFGFIRNKENPVWQQAADYYQAYFEEAVRLVLEDDWDLLVLDEINAAISLEILDVTRVVQFLKQKPEHLEVVLTGRNPAPEIAELADYISEIRKIRHPFDAGITAREGIEF
ncbi:MAG: cob(I)yrinic acid a,c-diamide adenosyltransferase [Parasporobacterium sp.]|nr:cob(I)yrinic acid a,c-diamide adenosyltransferase [Parasporobacterium sp.]